MAEEVSQIRNMGNILVKERNKSVLRNGKEMEECMEFCDGMMVTVQQGDTLYALSMKYQVPLDVLLRSNPYVDVYNLQEGEKICIPMRKRPMPEQCPMPEQWPAPEQRPMPEQRVMEETQRLSSQESEMQMQTETEVMNIEEDREENREDDRESWERYVTKQGDTLDMVVGSSMGREDDWEELLEEFVERNDKDRIFLLPGVAYYRRK